MLSEAVLAAASQNNSLSIIFSLLALIISVLVPRLEHKRDIKLNRKNLEADYFNDIYKKHLISNIPNARKYIRFDKEGRFKDIDKMCDVLKEIRTDSLYYYYNDSLFYGELKTQTQYLEDFLIKNFGKEFLGDEQTELLNKLHSELKKLYKIISAKYIY